MKQVLWILCLTCIVKLEALSSSADGKDTSRANEQRRNVEQNSAEDLEGSETTARFFNLGSLFPTYNPYSTTRPTGYPTVGSGYIPSSNGYYPNTGYYPTGTNVLGTGYSGYPTQSYYPTYGYSQRGYGNSGGYGGSSGYGGYSGYNGYGGYGGYGGNGGLNSYNGYTNPQYSGKRNLGYGYYSDTDRYGFYRSPSQQLSVNRGYD